MWTVGKAYTSTFDRYRVGMDRQIGCTFVCLCVLLEYVPSFVTSIFSASLLACTCVSNLYL